MRYVHRQIEPLVKRLVKSFPSLAVTGPRQSGKSTLLAHTLRGYSYVTLDDPLERERAISDPRLFLDSLGEPVIIDEIQYAPGILSCLKREIDRNRGAKGRYVFTSPQQFGMIQNLGDSLAGRIALLDLLPFSVGEKKSLRGKTTLDLFVHAALTGSFPEFVTGPRIDAPVWYGSYIQTYLERDIRGLHNIGNLRDFQRFMQLLAGRCAQLLNMSDFAKDLGVSVPTIKNWLSVLEASRLIYLLPPYFGNTGKRIVKAPKVYFTDIGLVCYLTGVRDKTHLLQGPLAGPLFENFCVQETIKAYSNQGQRPRLSYVRTSNDLEVDLLLELSANTVVPVEIKLSKTPTASMGAPIERFRGLFSRLEVRLGHIVSLSEQTAPLGKAVVVTTFRDYLREVEKIASPKQHP